MEVVVAMVEEAVEDMEVVDMEVVVVVMGVAVVAMEEAAADMEVVVEGVATSFAFPHLCIPMNV